LLPFLERFQIGYDFVRTFPIEGHKRLLPLAGGVLVCERGEFIRLSEQTKTPKHYEVVWRKGQRECGFECEGEKYPYTRSQTHSDSCTPLVEVSGSSEIIHLDKQTKTPKHYEVVWRKGQRECGFECEGEKYPHTQTHFFLHC
jgi:hypothetical protein